jgi:outer membrane receptor for ferrienterochelin and colicin
MRCLFLYLTGFISLLQVFGNNLQAQEIPPTIGITIHVKDASLSEVLEKIEQQTGMHFSYESTLLEGLPKISLSIKKTSLEDCLKKTFATYPILYQVSGKYIILKKKPKQVVVSGFVRDKASSESLIGASVYEQATLKGAATNSYGFFSVTLLPGDVTLNVSYIGYDSKMFSFKGLGNDTTLLVELEPGATLQEVVVVVPHQENQPVLNSQMGKLELNQQTIRTMPVMFGEADIIKTLQLTPGVAAGAEGFSGMYVRGGGVDENLFLIDGNPVYQVSHLGGLFSAFNTEAIRGMDFLKAGFPARYGGRLSSVVDIHTQEGNMKEYHGAVSLGLIAGNLSLEGPIVKDRTSFAIALRRTWLDVLTAPAFAIINNKNKYGEKNTLRYAFHDLNLKLNHRFNDRSRMFLSLYNGNDVMVANSESRNNYNEETTPSGNKTDVSLRWGNLLATAGWTYVFSNQLFGKISGVYTQYRSKMANSHQNTYGRKDEEGYEDSYMETSNVTGIMDAGVRSLFDYFPSSSHHIRFGGDFMLHRFRPEYGKTRSGDNSATDKSGLEAVFANELLWAKEFSAFAEDDWKISDDFRANGGVRYSVFDIDNKTYMGLEPRFSMRWLLDKDLSLKASYARMHQYVHLVSNSYINLPTDAWMPVTRRLKPLVSNQVSLGAYYHLKNEMGDFDISLEGYYKKMTNLLEYRDGYTFLPTFSSWEEKMAIGEGQSYGSELMIHKQTGKLTGWVGYTLSWSDRKFEELNEGKRFPSKFDNRHKLNIVGMYKLSSKVELSAAWTYASGNRMTLSLENYEGMLTRKADPWAGEMPYQPINYYVLDYYTKRNNYQLPAYHRLDVGIHIYRPKKNGRMGIWNISIYNVYSRMNPFMVYRSEKEIKVDKNSSYYVPCFKTIGIMPVIPSISYTYKF